EIPSGSHNNATVSVPREVDREAKEMVSSDDSTDEVPSKKYRIDSPLDIGSQVDAEKQKRVPQRGEPLDPNIDLFGRSSYHDRKYSERHSNVRGGCLRTPFIRAERSASVEEKLISGDEEMERIKMERVLKMLDMMKMSEKVMVDIITPDLMKNFRNPLEWNSLELQLFLDQFDVEQVFKDYVAREDFDGMSFFSLKVDEVLNEFPPLPEDKDFNEKIYIFSIVDKIKKICNDDSVVFSPPPFNLYDS
ncbi:hypothetical protein PMAYCL1PPCAC_17981, partial [Pristionchus mayeri]